MRHAGLLTTLALMAAIVAITGAVVSWSDRHAPTYDWTRAARNSLQPASIEVLALIDQPITVIAFVPEQPALRRGLIREAAGVAGDVPSLLKGQSF